MKTLTWSAPPTEPGVYIGLPHELHIATRALGSGDHRALYIDPASWWWHSEHNPLRPDPEESETHAKRFGGAAHSGLLEGTRTYQRHWWVHPCQDEYRDVLITTDDLKDWLRSAGLKVGGDKPRLIARVREADPCVEIWDDILADFHHRRGKRGWVTRDEDARIRLMRRVLEAMPDLHRSLKAGLSEVTVMWRDELSGALCRTRFDRLTARRIFELKIFARREDMTLREAALYSATRFRQHMQAALHMEAFDQAVELAGEGNVFGGTARQRRQMDKVLRSDPEFCWLFYPSNGTPTPEPIPLPRRSLVMTEGARGITEARLKYRAWHETYGLDRMWLSAAQPRPLDDDLEGFGFWRRT